jgi:hypothetical protein
VGAADPQGRRAGESQSRRGTYSSYDWVEEKALEEPEAIGPRLVAVAFTLEDSIASGRPVTASLALLAPLTRDPAWAEAAERLRLARPVALVDLRLTELATAYLEAKPFEPALEAARALEGSPIVTVPLFLSRVAGQPARPGGPARLLAEPPANSGEFFALWPELAEARPFEVPTDWTRLPTMTDGELRAFFRTHRARLGPRFDEAGYRDLAQVMGILDPAPPR